MREWLDYHAGKDRYFTGSETVAGRQDAALFYFVDAKLAVAFVKSAAGFRSRRRSHSRRTKGLIWSPLRRAAAGALCHGWSDLARSTETATQARELIACAWRKPGHMLTATAKAGLWGRMIMLRPIAALLCAICICGSVRAQEIAGKGQEAEALASQGKFVEAEAALDDAIWVVWEKAPLTFRRAMLVQEKAAGFGLYDPRASNVYAAGATIYVYAEPMGFGWRHMGDVWSPSLVTDVVIKTKDGKELFRKDSFSNMGYNSRERNRAFFANFDYAVTGLPPGEYVVDTVMHDTVTGKSGTFSLPFVIQ